jgi:hypothetical protein
MTAASLCPPTADLQRLRDDGDCGCTVGGHVEHCPRC